MFLEKNGIQVTETSIGLISVSRPRSVEDEIKNVRFLFENDRLYKIVVFFQIPEQGADCCKSFGAAWPAKGSLDRATRLPVKVHR